MLKKIMLIVIGLSIGTQVFANEREDSICGSVKEPFLFWLWSSAAPDSDGGRVSGLSLVQPVQYQTSDGKTLRGYKYASNDGNGKKTVAEGYILMALGNAMIADQIIPYMKKFSEKNYDVYIYDYRGYANSDGKRRLNAIIEDYKEIVSSLNNVYERKLLYGISLGGAIILNVIGSGAEYDAAVIDSSPSLLSEHGCPVRVDPIVNLPDDSSRLLVITGKKDPVLNEKITSGLRESALQKGAKVIDGDDFSHPFMDKSIAVHNQRMKLVLDHLLGQDSKKIIGDRPRLINNRGQTTKINGVRLD